MKFIVADGNQAYDGLYYGHCTLLNMCPMLPNCIPKSVFKLRAQKFGIVEGSMGLFNINS